MTSLESQSPSFERYLEAKRGVDDRATNRMIWAGFVHALKTRERPIHLLDVGTGLGSMVVRLAEWTQLSGPIRYCGLDRDEQLIRSGRKVLPEWFEAAGIAISESDRGLRTDGTLEIELQAGNVYDWTTSVDVIVAAAVCDILDIDRFVKHVETISEPGSVLYAPITFDGTTQFRPAHPADNRIEALYHRHMDEIRSTPGSSTAGRDLCERLRTSAFDVTGAGRSDWLIEPRETGYLPGDRIVLERMLGTIEQALAAYPSTTIASSTLKEWLSVRYDQLRDDQLSLRVRHLDILATR